MRAESTGARLFRRCKTVGECWEWQGYKNQQGYGRIGVTLTRKLAYTHRVAWEIFNDRPAPSDMEVCHHCDNPSCVNPAHLFLGTRQENKNDQVVKGRVPRGERFSNSKLSDAEARGMVAEYRRGDGSMRDVASRYGVSHQTLRRRIQTIGEIL